MRVWYPSALALALALSASALFSAPGFAQTSSAAGAHTTGMRYDIAGRPVGTIAPDPDGTGVIKFAAVRNTYNAQGWLVKTEKGELAAWANETVAPSAWTGFTIFQTTDISYDAGGRKIKEVLSSGGVAYAQTQWSYDATDRVLCEAVRMTPASNFASAPADACALTSGGAVNDRITRTTYYGNGRVAAVTKAYGTALQQDYQRYGYTGNGKIAWVMDANGTASTYVHDGHDRAVRWNFPSKTTSGVASTTDYEEYSYDNNDNRLTMRKRDGQVITYAYDALNRVTLKDIPGGTAKDVYYAYDNRNLQLSARFVSATGQGIVNIFDNAGRPTSSTVSLGGVSRALAYQWDKNGNRTRVMHPDTANYFNTVYDGLNRPKTIREINVATNVLANYTYDAQGRLLNLKKGATNETATATGKVTSSLGYDAISRPTSLGDVLAASAASNVSTSFSWTPSGQMASRVMNNDTYVWSGTVNLARSYTVNGLNQYLTAGPASFLYDANGNLTSDGSTSFTYDTENRMVAASGTKNATLAYDPLGRLWQVTSAGATTTFLYDGDELVAEYNANTTTVLRRYVHGGGVDDPIVWYEGAAVSDAQRRYMQVNHQGSITSIANNTGALIGTAPNSYDDWGIPASLPATPNQGRFQYTGQAYLTELGLYYYKARMYSPTLGRFMQTDPIGYKDQMNLYAYVGNDPMNKRDPSGLAACGARMAGEECEAFKAAQKEALLRVGKALVGLHNLGKERQEIKDGTRKELSQGAQKIQSELRSQFGSSSNKTAAVVTLRLMEIKSVLSNDRDYTFNRGNTSGDFAVTNPYSSTAKVGNEFFDTSFRNKVVTVLHEPAHMYGANFLIPESYEGANRWAPTWYHLQNADDIAIFAYNAGAR